MKLYEMLQTGLSTTEIYQSLISQQQAANVLLAGNYSLLPIYAPADPENTIKNGLLRKIMARYYNYDLFTDDTMYFGSRMFWKLNQIMPTYAARFAAVVTADEFAAAFSDGVDETINRQRKTDNSSTTTSKGSNTNTSTGESEQSDTSTNYNSDYPQIMVGGQDYNSAASKGIGTSKGTTSNTNNGSNESTGTYTGDMSEQYTENRNRRLSPDEILLAKQKITTLIINIDEEIVQAVSDLFLNIWDDDECDRKYKQKVETACKQMLQFAITLNKLNIRVSNLDFTEEQLQYIQQIPELKEQANNLAEVLKQLQTDVDNLAGQMLPAVTAEDADKILMVSDTGAWAALRLPNWAVEGF